MDTINLIWPVIIATVFSIVLTAVVLKLARQYHLALPPRTRDVHASLIPRLGGLAIFGAFFITTLIYQIMSRENFAGFGFPFKFLGISIDKRLLTVLVASLVLVAFMVYDDLKGLKAYQKLLVQVGVAAIAVAGGIGIAYLNNPLGGPTIYLNHWSIPVSIGSAVYHFYPIADGLVMLWLILMMNVMNFTDGIDGLAGSVSVIALLVLVLLSVQTSVSQPATALLAAIGLGSVLGFLGLNWPPAKIFMGDAGAMFLGFLIGVIGVIAGAKLATTMVVLALPILDALLVVISRLMNKQNPFTHADQSHLHHRFMRAGLTSRQTLFVLIIISALFGLAAFPNSGKAKLELFLLAIGLMAVLVMITARRSRTFTAN